jgi:putative ATPase
MFTQKSDEGGRPLAERMRPQTLDDFIGQERLVGPEGIVRKMAARKKLMSLLLWGPPGVGKTTLARILARETDAEFHQLSAVSAGVADVKKIIETARFNRDSLGRPTILFIDEIHRFNKAQQDVLLQSVEEGTLVFMGATTENPSFEVINPLLSRCRVYRLESLTVEHLEKLLRRALDSDSELKELQVSLTKAAAQALLLGCGGDARVMLNTLEIVAQNTTPDEQGQRQSQRDDVIAILQEHPLQYDKEGDYHYDLASAMIKSIRGSDPDAALYYMVRMLQGGEDVKFVARRLVIAASEDIGNADPAALPLATAAFQAVSMIGMPEAEIILSQTVTYLASAPKSNAAITGLPAIKEDIKKHGDLPVPLHIRNAPTKLMESMGHGEEYQYPHNFPGHFVEETYLPDALKDRIYYQPSENGAEKSILARLKDLWKNRRK